MKNLVIVFCLGGMLLGAGFLSFAGKPHGLEKKGKTPHGFTQGKKTGWQNEYPPGWDQKSEKEKKEWKDRVQKGRKNISKAAKGKGMTEKEAKSAADDFEKAARKGIDPEESESLVKDKIKKGKKDKGLSDAVAEKSEKRLKRKDKQDKGNKEKKEKSKGNRKK